MSRAHPVVAITGSSGAGTSTVTDTFQQIFAREGVNAAIVHGDSFHRYDREEMQHIHAEAAERGVDGSRSIVIGSHQNFRNCPVQTQARMLHTLTDS